MKFTKLIVTVLGLSLVTAHSYAEQTGYEVELIVYEDTTKRYIDSEDWSYNDMLNQTNSAVVNPESVEPDAQFSELDWEGAVLSDSLQKIQDSPGFNVLLTKRWRQTGLDRDKAYSVPIEAPAQEVTAETDNKERNENDINRLYKESVTGEGEVIPPPLASSIKGYVRLVMSRYLHFEVNLNYLKTLQDSDIDEYHSKIFPVVAERRMRSREIHYIDHPLVGIIVHASPYKIESSTEIQ